MAYVDGMQMQLMKYKLRLKIYYMKVKTQIQQIDQSLFQDQTQFCSHLIFRHCIIIMISIPEPNRL